MAEADKTADVPREPTEETEADRAAAFRAGYEGDVPPETATLPADGAVQAEAEQPTEQPAGAKAEVLEPAGPKNVQLTEEDYKLLRAAAEDAPALKQQLSKAFGTIGSLEQQLGQLKTQKGRVKIDKGAFAKLAQDFPEVYEALLPGLEAAEIDATAPQVQPRAGAQPVDPVELRKQVKAELLEERRNEEIEQLGRLIPGWREIVGKRDDADHPFRKWYAKQPESYRNFVDHAVDARVTADCIRKYQRDTTPRPQAQARTTFNDRARAAIPARGAGAAPLPTMPTRQDAFRDGYNNPG